MRVIYSDKEKQLYKTVKPYIEIVGLDSHIKADAPQEIKELYEEWKELSNKEDMEAMGYYNK